MQGIEELFFELLQVAIGTRKTLSRTPSADEWKELFEMSKKQALTAIAMAGVTKLNRASDYGASLGIPEVLYLKWLGMTAKVAQRNKQVTEACVELVRQYAHDGIATCILKGQGNLEYYPEGLKECRTPGDIDVWVKTPSSSPCLGGERGIPIAVADLDGKGAHYEYYSGNRGVIEYVKMLHRVAGTEPTEGVRYHHIDAPSINGIEVEAHFRPLFLDSPLRNWRLQRWFRENEQFQTLSNSPCLGRECRPDGKTIPLNRGNEGGFPIPTVSFNAVYQLCHIYRHLFDEGIGLRQLLDYYFVLRALHIEQGELADLDSTCSPTKQSMAQWAEWMGIAVKSNEEVMRALSRFGMKKFASATMYVLQTVFTMPGEYLICRPNEREGKFLLNEILMAGNFGKYDERISRSTSQMGHAWEKLKHNFRLIRHYPEEVMWEPFFRLYHYFWRRLRLWRF